LQQREFGRTGLKVSELVFGCGAVGGLMINADPKVRAAAFNEAINAGINWFDTAAAYGNGKSETNLGALLAAHRESKGTTADTELHVSTKFTLDTRNPNFQGQIERALTDSLERLQTNRITLLQLHNPIGQRTEGRTIGLEEILKPHGVLDILDDFREQGLIDHIGITALGDVAALTRVIKSNRIDSAQVYFNLLNPSASMVLPPAWPCTNFTGIIETCFEHGVAPMNIRVFSAGVIATNERHGREQPITAGDTIESESAKAAHLFARVNMRGDSRAQMAVRFALAQSRLACVVVGLEQTAYLSEAIIAAERGALPESSLTEIKAAWASFSAS
jgi:aryl-alcohol dehydrogenase-like predicted oxidoreductase